MYVVLLIHTQMQLIGVIPLIIILYPLSSLNQFRHMVYEKVPTHHWNVIVFAIPYSRRLTTYIRIRILAIKHILL